MSSLSFTISSSDNSHTNIAIGYPGCNEKPQILKQLMEKLERNEPVESLVYNFPGESLILQRLALFINNAPVTNVHGIHWSDRGGFSIHCSIK